MSSMTSSRLSGPLRKHWAGGHRRRKVEEPADVVWPLSFTIKGCLTKSGQTEVVSEYVYLCVENGYPENIVIVEPNVNNTSSSAKVVFLPVQQRFLGIPQSPLCYWLRDKFFDLLAGKTLGDVASVAQGLATANDSRFVRYTWEIPPAEWTQEIRNRRRHGQLD